MFKEEGRIMKVLFLFRLPLWRGKKILLATKHLFGRNSVKKSCPSIVLLLSLFVFIFTFGCRGRLYKEAENAYELQNYGRAASLYELALAGNPGSRKITKKLWQARKNAIEHLLRIAEVQRDAAFNLDAAKKASEIVPLRDSWYSGEDRWRLDTSQHERIDALSKWTNEFLTRTVQDALDDNKPLLAMYLLSERRSLFKLSSLSKLIPVFEDNINTKGIERCKEFRRKIGKEKANLWYFIGLYCRNFSNNSAESVNLLPDSFQVTSIKVMKDSVADLIPEEQMLFEKVLNRSLRASIWYHSFSGRTATVDISGTHNVTFSESKAIRVANWMEVTPYEVQESYTDCSPSTIHASEYGKFMRGEPICHKEFRTVTEYHETPQSFEYEVMQHKGDYHTDWILSVDMLNDDTPLSVKISENKIQVSDEHDVTFNEAGIRPRISTLLSREDWFRSQLKKLESQFKNELQEHWFNSFCKKDFHSPEDAARCGRGARQETPKKARELLSELFADDTDALFNSKRLNYIEGKGVQSESAIEVINTSMEKQSVEEEEITSEHDDASQNSENSENSNGSDVENISIRE